LQGQICGCSQPLITLAMRSWMYMHDLAIALKDPKASLKIWTDMYGFNNINL